MAFDKQYLSLLAHGGGFNLWHYRTLDAPAVVDSAGYFTGDAVNMLGVGDLIIVQDVDDIANPGTVNTSGFHLVLSNDGTTVDVSDTTAIAVTDTD